MIPLVFFLFAWMILVGIFLIVALITVYMAVRYGLSGPITAFTTLLFIAVTCFILFGTAFVLMSVDWTQSINLIPSMGLPSSL